MTERDLSSLARKISGLTNEVGLFAYPKEDYIQIGVENLSRVIGIDCKVYITDKGLFSLDFKAEFTSEDLFDSKFARALIELGLEFRIEDGYLFISGYKDSVEDFLSYFSKDFLNILDFYK